MDTRTGEIRQFNTPEEAKAAGFDKPLKNAPNPKCKKCYGRGHTGRNLTTGHFEPCYCTGAPKEKSKWNRSR